MVTGFSLCILLVVVFGISKSTYIPLVIGHVVLSAPFVYLSVTPKLKQMDRSLPEAAMDLGCTPMRAFFKATLPEIMPGIITGMLMAFTLSLDDFVISYFTTGNSFQTLPIRIYNMTKKTVTPKMYALATIIFFVILTLLLISNTIDTDSFRSSGEGGTGQMPPRYTLSTPKASAVRKADPTLWALRTLSSTSTMPLRGRSSRYCAGVRRPSSILRSFLSFTLQR